MNILFTGGRVPATLDLARAFHRAGHTVFMAESLRGHLSQPSAVVKANFVVPAPRQESEAFLSTLTWIVEENRIELLIPTCEEIFHIAKGLDRLPCRVFAEPLKKLNHVHNKWNFVITAIENDLHIPESMLVRNTDDLLHSFAQWKGLVLKPIYSRFAARTLILPSLKKALATLDHDSIWIAQEFIPGDHYCTYSVCHNGVITAHTTYPSIYKAGHGATIAFEHVEHVAVEAWVRRFVAQTKFTGQIAFDFIESPERQIYALECNPRATSGVHLLAAHPQFVDSFLNPEMDCIKPAHGRSYMLGMAMILYGLPAALTRGSLGEWLRTFFNSDDVILDFKDLLPALLQWRSILNYWLLALKKKITVLEASTFDIEWNGEK